MEFFDSFCDLVGDCVDTVIDNPIKSLVVVATTVATGGIALAAAPAIGALVSAAGLAALGGGSLSVGGAGIAGGTAVVAGIGATTGAATSAVVVTNG